MPRAGEVLAHSAGMLAVSTLLATEVLKLISIIIVAKGCEN